MISLFFADSCFLVGASLESVRIGFNVATDLHIHLFPYLIYPGAQFSQTLSTWLTVSIAIERFRAVKNPITYRYVILMIRKSTRLNSSRKSVV